MPRPARAPLAAALLALLPPTLARNNLALTPPMGFMTWQLFRCNGPGASGPADDCSDPNTTYCISDALIRGQAAAMHARGFVAAGYTTASLDDCWMQGRNATTQKFEAFRQGFPSGTLAPTAAAVHALGMRLGAYTAESRGTCCGHEASQGFEAIDAATFAEWGVDYLKVRSLRRGCAWRRELFHFFFAAATRAWLREQLRPTAGAHPAAVAGRRLQQQRVLLRNGLPSHGLRARGDWRGNRLLLLLARLHHVRRAARLREHIRRRLVGRRQCGLQPVARVARHQLRRRRPL
jgi:hypothetical protein